MAALVAVLLVLTVIGGSDAAWCVCRSDVGDPYLQQSLDYACGAGADCSPILQNGACYNPNTVRSHCSYAANSYYQRNGQAQTACNFSGTATLTTTDPSYTSCTFPSSPSAASGTSSTPSTGTGTATPGVFSPPNGALGGGLGPSGSFSTDSSGGFLLNGSVLTVICSGLIVMIIASLV